MGSERTRRHGAARLPRINALQTLVRFTTRKNCQGQEILRKAEKLPSIKGGCTDKTVKGSERSGPEGRRGGQKLLRKGALLGQTPTRGHERASITVRYR